MFAGRMFYTQQFADNYDNKRLVALSQQTLLLLLLLQGHFLIQQGALTSPPSTHPSPEAT